MKAPWKTTLVALLGLLLASPLLGQDQPQDQEQACVPQFVDGILGPLRFRTTLFLHNQDQDQAQLRLRFFDSLGQPMEGFMLRERGGLGMGQQVGPGGEVEPGPIGGGAGRSLRSEGQGALQSGFCIVESPQRIRAQARLQLFGADNELISETSLNPANRFRRGSFFADRTESQEVGLTLANTSPDQTAACTLEVFEEGGEQPLASTEIELGPRSQTARFLFELVPEILTDDVGFIRISCDEPVCGLALQLRGLRMLEIPIFVDDELINP